jgi:hypothetical protein
MKYRDIFENGKLQFTTIDGKVIQSYKTMAEKQILDTRFISKGFYLIQVIKEGINIKTFKLQK